jgi:hypothetical protein
MEFLKLRAVQISLRNEHLEEAAGLDTGNLCNSTNKPSGQQVFAPSRSAVNGKVFDPPSPLKFAELSTKQNPP